MATRAPGSFTLSRMPPEVRDPEGRAALQWVFQEFESLIRRLNAPSESRYTPIAREPTRPKTGMQVYADGTHWDPGSGEGPYYYGSDGEWHPMFGDPDAIASLLETNEAMLEHIQGLHAALEQLVMITAAFSGVHVQKNELPDAGLGYDN